MMLCYLVVVLWTFSLISASLYLIVWAYPYHASPSSLFCLLLHLFSTCTEWRLPNDGVPGLAPGLGLSSSAAGIGRGLGLGSRQSSAKSRESFFHVPQSAGECHTIQVRGRRGEGREEKEEEVGGDK